MEKFSYFLSAGAFAVMIALWILFAAIFLKRATGAPTIDGKRIPKSFIGLGLQGLSYLPVWMAGRVPMFSPFIDEQFVLNIILQIAAVGIAAASVWLAAAAVRELGRQWSLQARLVEGHQLITSGVYQTVRHPIYTAMLGMLVATGIVYSYWWASVAAILIFIVGTRIRTVSEEKLLADSFGREFTVWKEKVPGLIPFLKI